MIIIRDRAQSLQRLQYLDARLAAERGHCYFYSRSKLHETREIPMNNQERQTILLIDDHPMLRTGVKQLVVAAPHVISVVGEA